MDELRMEEANQRLRRAAEAGGGSRLLALLDHLDEIIFEFAPDGTYLNVWTGDETLLRRPPEELLGRRIEEVLGSSFWECFRPVFTRVLATGRAETHEYPLEVLGGPRWFMARVAPIPAADGKSTTLVFLARDITQRKQMEEELLASERRFHQILEQIQLAAFVLDAEGQVVFCNDFLLRLLGHRREDIEGGNWFEFAVPPEDRERVRDIWRETLLSPRNSQYLEYPLLTRSGGRRLVAWNTIIQRDRRGRPLFGASIGEDITERREAEEILRRNDQMKSEFISTAAHELRTPLTTIMGFSELLLQPEQFHQFTPEQRYDFLQEIHAKAEVLTGIINELLDLSRIEAGRSIPLDLTPCNLDDILRREIRHYRARFPRRRIVLELEARCPPTLLIDPNRIEQVVENVLSNAVKYSAEGGQITVTARLEGDSYRVSVTDEGIGMTAEQVAQIFDNFYRADASDTARRGLGLGLCIARGIIEAHGGRISVVSAPGRGTTIDFSLPVKRNGE